MGGKVLGVGGGVRPSTTDPVGMGCKKGVRGASAVRFGNSKPQLLVVIIMMIAKNFCQ